jgi:4-hydroxybenzoate polyprenyltransferase
MPAATAGRPAARTGPGMAHALLQAMRPHQWVKNLLVFAPLVFAHKVGQLEALGLAAVAFACLCAASSAVYLLNDFVDRAADRNHPKKRLRPIASGRLPAPLAAAAVAGLLAVAAVLGAWIPASPAGLPFLVWPAGYLLLNVAYTFWLKRVVIVDAICIALGFQVRVLAGADAVAARASSWILLCTFFFALFLAFCKRREEVMKHAGGETRASLRHYDAHFLDQMINPLAAMSILAYALYTVDEKSVGLHGPGLPWTVPFVVFGVFRYLYLVHRRGQGSDPARLLFTDPQILISGLLWAASVALVFTLR